MYKTGFSQTDGTAIGYKCPGKLEIERPCYQTPINTHDVSAADQYGSS